MSESSTPGDGFEKVHYAEHGGSIVFTGSWIKPNPSALVRADGGVVSLLTDCRCQPQPLKER